MKQSTMKKWRLLGIVLVAFIVGVVGCPETQHMMAPVITEPTDTPPVTMGEVKEPEEKPAEPEEEQEETPAEEKPEVPADTTPPTVVEVAWYRDWQMTKPLTMDSTVRPGDTIYTVVSFSEPVVHTVADDDTARPALFIVTDGMTTQYRMLQHKVRFQSGEAKPLRDGTDTYLCKYTIPADTVGTLTLRTGDTTADMAGNAAKASEHIAPFVLPELEPVVEQPMVTEETAQEKAEEIVRRIMGLQNEDHVINNRDLMTEILEQESGLAYSFIYGTLFQGIYLEERPEEKGESFSWYDTVLEYLRLGFLYPGADEEGLLAHFRQSVRDGRVEVDLAKSEFIKRERDARAAAREVYLRFNLGDALVKGREREIAAVNQKRNDPTFDLDIARAQILREEFGDKATPEIAEQLLKMHLELFPEDRKRVEKGEYFLSEIMMRYINESTASPEKSREEIFTRLREIAIVPNQKPRVLIWEFLLE